MTHFIPIPKQNRFAISDLWRQLTLSAAILGLFNLVGCGEHRQPVAQDSDMIVLSDQNNQGPDDRFNLEGKYPINFSVSLWPLATIPYVITQEVIDSPDYHGQNLRTKVIKAIEDIEAKTSIKFVEYRDGDHDYHLKFMMSSYPHSYLGNIKATQGQALYLTGSIAIPGIEHEIGHALGLFHEESRADRDEYALIHKEHMDPQCYQAYIQPTFNSGYNLKSPYDFNSLMHASYGICRSSGSPNRPTIEPKNGDSLPEPRVFALSALDIAEIEDLYHEEILLREPIGDNQGSPTCSNLKSELFCDLVSYTGQCTSSSLADSCQLTCGQCKDVAAKVLNHNDNPWCGGWVKGKYCDGTGGSRIYVRDNCSFGCRLSDQLRISDPQGLELIVP